MESLIAVSVSESPSMHDLSDLRTYVISMTTQGAGDGKAVSSTRRGALLPARRRVPQYPIIGRRAAREAIRRAAGEFMDVDDSVSSAAPPGHWQNLAKLWKTLLASVEGSEKMVKAVTGIAEAIPKLTNAVSTL